MGTVPPRETLVEIMGYKPRRVPPPPPPSGIDVERYGRTGKLDEGEHMSREAWCFWAAIFAGVFFGGAACGACEPVYVPIAVIAVGAAGLVGCLLAVYRIDERVFWERLRQKAGSAGLDANGNYTPLSRGEEDAIEAYYQRKFG
jgi:hypothetical protein